MEQQSKPGAPKPDERGNPSRRAARAPVRIGGRPSTTEKTTSKALLATIAIHLMVGFVIVRLVALGHGFYDWFGLRPMYQPTEEHIVYVEPPKPKVVEPKPLVKPKPTVAQVQRPSTGPVVGVPTPVVAPPVEVPATGTGTGGVGDTTGGGGPRRNLGINPALVGIAPANADPRIWAPGPAGINVPRSAQQLLDSVVAYAITSAADSLDSIARLYNPGKAAGDWTKRLKNGEKWGWDQTGLRLGKITVPNALLALLPAGIQQSLSGNPLAMAQSRRVALMREDINRFSQQSMSEASFRKEIKELRVKKEREHNDQMKAKAAAKAAASTPPP